MVAPGSQPIPYLPRPAGGAGGAGGGVGGGLGLGSMPIANGGLGARSQPVYGGPYPFASMTHAAHAMLAGLFHLPTNSIEQFNS